MLTLNFNPFPLLTTERLVLRELRETDKDDLFAIRSNPETMRFVPRPVAQVPDDVMPLLQTINAATAAAEKVNWVITEKGEDKLIGMIGFVNLHPEVRRGEIGYSLNKAYERKGIMLEAMRAVMDYGINVMKLHSVEAVIHPDNIASWKLVEKYGFTRDAYFRDYNFHNGKFADAVVYSFIHPE